MITKPRRLVRPAVSMAAGALILGIALSIARIPAQATTTTITVSGTGDTASPPVCTTSCATLRGAVAAANAVYRAGGSGFTQLVKHADTRTTVGSSANPSEFGQSVHFTATVAPVPAGAGTAGGAVQFVVDGSNLGAPVTPTAGVADSDGVSTLGVGPHTVMANYLGDTSFNASGGSLTPVGQIVQKSDSSTAVSSSQNPSAFGQAVQFTAQVSAAGTGAGTPDGTVQFVIDDSSFGGPVTLSGGSAMSGSLASLAVGNHTVRADYNASADYNAGSGTLAGGQAVTMASTATTLASSQTSPSATPDSPAPPSTSSSAPPSPAWRPRRRARATGWSAPTVRCTTSATRPRSARWRAAT